MATFKKHLLNKYLIIGIIITALFTLGGCYSSIVPNQNAHQADKLRTPFIPAPDNTVTTGYIFLQKPKDSSNSAELLLNNSRNDFHVKVAVFQLTDSQALLTTIVTIRKNEQVTLTNFAAGKYEVQFRNLYTGKYFKLIPGFELADNSSKSIPLYQTTSGNITVKPYLDAEF